MNTPNTLFAVTAAAAAAFTLAGPARANDRAFTYVYEATTLAEGSVELEQWVTWKTDKDTDSSYDRLDFRTEVEIGLTDDLQLGLYLADWRYEDGASVADDGAEFRNVAAELIYNLSNPTTDLLGVALYGEIQYGPEKFELEGKLILHKNIDAWIIAYNATFEAEWEGAHYQDDKGVFEQTLGVSYQISPRLTTGAEFLHEIEFDDFEHTGDDVIYFGPNVSVRRDRWWVTCTLLFQVTDIDSEANYQLRTIVGFDF